MTSNEQLCSICNKNIKSQYICEKCAKSFCADCLEKNQPSSNKKLCPNCKTELSEKPNQQKNTNSSNENQDCEIHKLPKNRFCQTCLIPICPKCEQEHDSTHKFTDRNDDVIFDDEIETPKGDINDIIKDNYNTNNTVISTNNNIPLDNSEDDQKEIINLFTNFIQEYTSLNRKYLHLKINNQKPNPSQTNEKIEKICNDIVIKINEFMLIKNFKFQIELYYYLYILYVFRKYKKSNSTPYDFVIPYDSSLYALKYLSTKDISFRCLTYPKKPKKQKDNNNLDKYLKYHLKLNILKFIEDYFIDPNKESVESFLNEEKLIDYLSVINDMIDFDSFNNNTILTIVIFFYKNLQNKEKKFTDLLYNIFSSHYKKSFKIQKSELFIFEYCLKYSYYVKDRISFVDKIISNNPSNNIIEIILQISLAENDTNCFDELLSYFLIFLIDSKRSLNNILFIKGYLKENINKSNNINFKFSIIYFLFNLKIINIFLNEQKINNVYFKSAKNNTIIPFVFYYLYKSKKLRELIKSKNKNKENQIINLFNKIDENKSNYDIKFEKFLNKNEKISNEIELINYLSIQKEILEVSFETDFTSMNQLTLEKVNQMLNYNNKTDKIKYFKKDELPLSLILKLKNNGNPPKSLDLNEESENIDSKHKYFLKEILFESSKTKYCCVDYLENIYIKLDLDLYDNNFILNYSNIFFYNIDDIFINKCNSDKDVVLIYKLVSNDKVKDDEVFHSFLFDEGLLDINDNFLYTYLSFVNYYPLCLFKYKQFFIKLFNYKELFANSFFDFYLDKNIFNGLKKINFDSINKENIYNSLTEIICNISIGEENKASLLIENLEKIKPKNI